MSAPTSPDLLALLETSGDLFSIARADGRFTWMSDGWADALGHSIEELLSVPFLTWVHPDDADATTEVFASLLGEVSARVVGFTNRYRHKDGSWRWLQWNAYRHEDGLIYSTTRDVSSDHERLLAMTERLRLIEAAERLAGVGTWRVDLGTMTTRWSPEVLSIHGLDPTGTSPDLQAAIDFYHPDDRARVARVVEEAIRDRGTFTLTARIVRADGEIRQVSSRGMVDEAGDTLFGVFRDITDEMELRRRAALDEQLATLGSMAAGLAHEINNPAAWIATSLDFVAEQVATSSDPDLLDAIGDARDGLARIRTLVNSLRDFTSVGETPESVDFASLVDTVQRTATTRGVTAVTTDQTRNEPVLCDPTRMRLVLENLVSNAAYAQLDRGANDPIEVVGDIADACLRVRVLDRGVGIGAGDVERAFEPFFSTRRSNGGTGLGLSLSRTWISGMGGTITLAPRDGGGTVAEVRLPLQECPARDRDDERPRILVVDDEPLVLKSLSRVLAADGWVTRTAESADQARGVMAAPGVRFDVVLCDVKLGSDDGTALMRHLMGQHRGLHGRVVFMTGDAGRDAEDLRARTTGGTLLRKPFSNDELRRVLAEVRGATP